MNEIDPANSSNGSVTTENHQQQAAAAAASSTSSNKSPLLSSLLTSIKQHESVSNGQQSKVGQHKLDKHDGMMPTPAVNNSTQQYDESNAFMTKKLATTESKETANELDLSTTPQTNNSHKKFHNNLNDLLQRNNNNNKESTAKSILENCLLKPSPLKTQQQPQQQRLESQIYNTKMEEGEYHHHHPSTSSVLKFAEDNRKVEPLKINLNREPIRTVIKLPPSYESTTKITIKPPHNNVAPSTISPTLSSSSSLSSESSFENSNDVRSSSIQVIPKLHIRNVLDGSLNHEQSEQLLIVPKLTITGLSSPQSTQNNVDKDHSSVNSSISETTSPTIPKLTIKKDNHTSDYHLNNEANNSIPKLHIKATNHHQAKDVKLTFKPFPEPSVPKLTIKTVLENDAMIVSASESNETQTAIPKFTIKSNAQSSTPKLTIKPVVRSPDEPEESIPKITLKAVNNSESFEKVVPKLVVKVPKESHDEDDPSPPHVPKLNIKPIPPPPTTTTTADKEVPKLSKNCVEPAALSEVKFSINRLIGSSEASEDGENEGCKPLEINTTSVVKSTDSGQDSPRIILKINKTNSETITSEIVPQPTTEPVQKLSTSNHKRSHTNDGHEETAKKAKMNHSRDDKEDVILINDSDTSSSDALNKNHHSTAMMKALNDDKAEDTPKSNMSGLLQRSLRQSRRKNEAAAAKAETQPAEVEKVQPPPVKEECEFDPLALSSNDATVNSNSVDELITPKRGRGRPKKIVEKTPQIVEEESRDPLEVPLPPPPEDSTQATPTNEDGSEVKKVSSRGRGRGRGRGSKRTVEVMKNGKPIQITLEGHDDDDSPSFSLYNRSLKPAFGMARKGRGGKSLRGKGAKTSPFATPERSRDGHFMSPNDQNNRRKLFNTPSLFEEDTRMSIGGGDSAQATPVRYSEPQSCEESQSSLISSASNTVEGSVKKRAKKMEISEAEG